MTAGPVGTALACPSCGSDRVRRQSSFSAAIGRGRKGRRQRDRRAAMPGAPDCWI
jgi:hypothetical protein